MSQSPNFPCKISMLTHLAPRQMRPPPKFFTQKNLTCRPTHDKTRTMNGLSFQKVLDIPPKFVLEIAMGLRDPKEVAEDYGFTEEQWTALKAHDPFVKQVDEKKAELKASGWTFKMKSAIIAEELLADLYLKATEEGATLHAVLESLKFTAKAAGLDAPKQDTQAAGSGFSINITIGGQSVKIAGSATPQGDVYDMEEHFDFTQSFGSYEPVPLPA